MLHIPWVFCLYPITWLSYPTRKYKMIGTLRVVSCYTEEKRLNEKTIVVMIFSCQLNYLIKIIAHCSSNDVANYGIFADQALLKSLHSTFSDLTSIWKVFNLIVYDKLKNNNLTPH